MPGKKRIYQNDYEKNKAYHARHNIQRLDIMFKPTPELNKEKIKAAADSEGLSVSQFVLRAVSAAIDERG